ncbi:MAG: ATP-binding cassette domain-containing protein [Mycoplasmatales bacterium]
MSEIVKIDSLYHHVRNKKVLYNINFSINKGEIVGLLGHNGAGKSTILRKLSSLEGYSNGSIKFEGKELSSLDIEAKDIILIPDKNILIKYLTVEENAKIFQEMNENFDYDYFNQKMIDLEINKDARIASFSKGLREIIMIALFISIDTKLILMDEPLASIDIFTRDFIVDMIIDKQSTGTSFIITTHLLNDIQDIIERVIYLHDAKIHFDLTLEEILKEHGSLVEFLKKEFNKGVGK